MRKYTKRKLLIILVLLLAVFTTLFIISAVQDYKTYYGKIHIKNEVIGYIFLGLIFFLIIMFILLLIVVKEAKLKAIADKIDKKRTFKHQKPSELDFFYLSQAGIEDVDSKLVREIKFGETIIQETEENEEEEEDPSEQVIEVNAFETTEQNVEEVEEVEETYEEPLPSDLEVIGGDDDEENENKKNANDLSIEEELTEGESRFYNLTQIDAKMEGYLPPRYNNDISLEEVCETFRNFCSRNLRLYYDIDDIRRFIAGLSVTKLIILQGMSGTGKTSLAYAFGEFLGNTTTVIPVQPMWKERTDLVGYYNEFTKRFNETQLLYKMYEANYNDEIFITVLDEMNIARIEYYFAEFLSLLEIPNLDGRMLDVVADKWENDPKKLSEKGQIKLPFNMWFIGTANNDDSTFAISDKVYDRAMVINLDKKAKPFDAPKTDRLKLSCEHLTELYKEAQKEYKMSDRNTRRIRKLDEYMIKTFHLTFGNRIMRQIESYVPVMVACGGTETEAIDDILARKVFRKLESKNPVYVRQMAENICSYLDDLFGADKLPLCKEAIHLIEQNI